MIGPLTNRGHPVVPTVDVRREEIICGMKPRRPDYSMFCVAGVQKFAMKIQLARYRMAAHAFTAVLDVLSIRYLLEMSRLFACGDKEIHGTTGRGRL